MKIIKIGFLCIIFGLIGLNARAQQKPVFSQYIFNPLIINPAYAGSEDQLSVSALYRNQWVNFPGAPEIKTFTANTAFANKKIGIGLNVVNDKIGIHNNMGVYGAYAYRIKYGTGVLSMGVQAGFDYLTSDFNKLTIKDQSDPNLNGTLSKFNPNFGAGLFWYNSKTFLGFSVPYLINSKIYDGNDFVSEAKSRRYYFLSGGHVFTVSPNLKIRPSTMIRVQENAPLGVDLNVHFVIKDLIVVGNSYRSGDANIVNFEFRLNENFRVGYAYEFVLSGIGPHQRGSHEVMINYRINIPGLSKGIPCPSYY